MDGDSFESRTPPFGTAAFIFLIFWLHYGAFNIHEAWKNKHLRLFPPNRNVMVSNPRENNWTVLHAQAFCLWLETGPRGAGGATSWTRGSQSRWPRVEATTAALGRRKEPPHTLKDTGHWMDTGVLSVGSKLHYFCHWRTQKDHLCDFSTLNEHHWDFSLPSFLAWPWLCIDRHLL